MVEWMQPDYWKGDAHIFDTPEEQKIWKIHKETRTLQEQLQDFLSKYGPEKKEEPLKFID